MAKFIELHQFFNRASDATAHPIYINVDYIVTMSPEKSYDGVSYTVINTLMPNAESIRVKETIDEIQRMIL